MKKLFETTPELMVSGLCPGLMPEQIPLWSTGSEVRFENASVKTVPGRERLFDFTSDPLDAAQNLTLGRKRLYLATRDGVYRYIGPQQYYENASLLSTQPAEGSFSQILALSQERCTLVTWGDWIISTDGINPVKLDKNTGTMSSLTMTTSLGSVTYAGVIWKYQKHLFAADTNLSGRQVYWSALDDPETWLPSLSNDAGRVPLRELENRIRAAALLGQNCGIYSGDQMVLSRYIGGSEVFAFSSALTGLGALGPKTIIPHNRYNWGLTRRGIFYTDGVQFEYVDEPTVRAWVKANVNFALGEYIVGYHDEAAQMVCWCCPMLDGTYRTIGFGYKSQAFTIFGEGVLFGREADTFDDCIIGTHRTVSIQGSGTTPASTITTKPMHLGTREAEKLFQMVRLDLTWDGDVTIELGFSDNSLDDVSWEQSKNADDLDGLCFHLDDAGRSSNCMSMRISADAGSSFRLGGFEIHGEGAGYFK